MEGRIDFSEEVDGLLEKLASTQSLPEKTAAERLVAILKEKLHREPEKLRRLSTALNQVLLQICNSDGDVVTVKQVPQVFLERVESILEGYDELIVGFNSFLRVQNPKKPEIVIDQEFVAGFMEIVRNCGELVYKPFTEILKQYKLEKKMNSDELFSKMQVTFYDYPDLEEEFAKSLSDSRATTRVRHHPDSACINTAKKSREVVQVERKKRKARDEEIELERTGGKERKLEMKRASVQVEDCREEIKLKREGGKEKKLEMKRASVQVEDCREEIKLKREGGKEKKFVQVEDRSVEIELETEGGEAEKLEAKNSWGEENFDAKTLKLKAQALCFFGEVKQRLSCLMRYKDFLEQFFNYSNETTQRAEFESRIFGLLSNHSDLMSEFQLLIKNSESATMSCTPSYRLLTEDYPKPLATGRTELEMEVLNDCWVSVPCNEGSSNSRQHSQKEKMMFKDEDDRYEKDMVVGWFVSAIQFAEQKLLSPSAEGPGQLRLRRCVEQLYGDQASEVLSMIEMEPEKTLPVVKKRLKKKLKEMKSLVQ